MIGPNYQGQVTRSKASRALAARPSAASDRPRPAHHAPVLRHLAQRRGKGIHGLTMLAGTLLQRCHQGHGLRLIRRGRATAAERCAQRRDPGRKVAAIGLDAGVDDGQLRLLRIERQPLGEDPLGIAIALDQRDGDAKLARAAEVMDITAHDVDQLARSHWHWFTCRIGETIGPIAEPNSQNSETSPSPYRQT
jgi:hypothetical protein